MDYPKEWYYDEYFNKWYIDLYKDEDRPERVDSCASCACKDTYGIDACSGCAG